MGRYLGAKVWLTLATWVLALLFAGVMQLSLEAIAQLALLLAAASLMSYGDMFMSCFRAMGQFGEEAWIAVLGNVLFFALSLCALHFKGGPVGVAAAMLFARLVQFLMSQRVFRRRIPERVVPVLALPEVAATVRASTAYGADVAIGAAFVNMDTVMIAHTLGQESVGVYQAIARIYQGAVLATAILGSIFLPRLARELGNRVAFTRQYKQLAWCLVALGAAASCVFALGAPLLELIYTQPHLQRSLELMPWFALLVFVRFTASVYGVALTALGKQTSRALIYVAALILMVLAAPPLMRHFGEAGMVIAATLAYALLALLFAIHSARSGVRPQAWKTAAIVSLSLTAFSFWKAGLHP